MRCHSRLSVLLLGVISAVHLPATGTAQQAGPANEPGIWIADAGGDLRAVQPVRRSFLRQQSAAAGELQVVLSVESFAHSATGALSAGELAVTRVRHAISGAGVAAGALESELAFLEPRYRLRLLAGSWEKPHQLGFDAGFVVTVQAANRASVGRLVDAAMGAGATRVLAIGSEATP